MNRDMSFFREIRQFEGKAGGFTFPMPIFYYDVSAFFVVFTGSYSEVVKLLPSPRLKPYRVLINRAPIVLAAFSYRDTDIGPYNEFAVAVPVALDASKILPGPSILRSLIRPNLFITHLPVTTEIALQAGKEIYNFPKFIANIDFEQGEGEIAVQISEGNEPVLTLTIPAIKGRRKMGLSVNSFTSRADRILRCEVTGEAEGMAFAPPSRGLRHVKLSLGQSHFMSRDLNDLKLGRPLAVAYMPKGRMILTNPLDARPIIKK